MSTNDSASPDNGIYAACHATDSRLPTTWQCPTPLDVCLSLANGTSAYCCDPSTNCTLLAPLPRIRITAHHVGLIQPDPRVFMSSPRGSVEVCGKGCCPRGYHCLRPGIVLSVHEPICRINGWDAISPNSLAASEATSILESGTSSAASTGVFTVPTATATASGGGEAGENMGAGKDGGKHAATDAAVIAGGTIGAAVGVVAVVLAVMIWLRYIRKQRGAGGAAEKTQNGDQGAGAGEQQQQQNEEGYWSFDGRRDAEGRLERQWSESTLRPSRE